MKQQTMPNHIIGELQAVSTNTFMAQTQTADNFQIVNHERRDKSKYYWNRYFRIRQRLNGVLVLTLRKLKPLV